MASMTQRDDVTVLTATQRSALVELRANGNLRHGASYTQRTLQALVRAGYGVWRHPEPGSATTTSHIDLRRRAARSLEDHPGLELGETVLVCQTCEDYVEYPVLGYARGKRVHLDNGKVRCPGQGDDATDDRVSASGPLPARLYPVQGRFLLDLGTPA